MESQDRLSIERDFHDQQAVQRRRDLNHPDRFRFSDEEWLDHETWIRPAMRLLEPVAGLPILDLGCGHGMAGIVLARRGANVTSVDLSAGYLREVQDRARANGVTLQTVQSEGERLPFASATFARIWGNAILHHLDLKQAGPELFRILQPGGWAVFCEPWAGNPLLRFARRRLPYPGKARTTDEEPLGWTQIRLLKETFPGLEIQGYQLFGMLRRVISRPGVVHNFHRLDDLLLRTFPHLAGLCRYVVVTLRRPCNIQ